MRSRYETDPDFDVVMDELLGMLGRVFSGFAILAVPTLVWHNVARVFDLPTWAVFTWTFLAFAVTALVLCVLHSGGRDATQK